MIDQPAAEQRVHEYLLRIESELNNFGSALPETRVQPGVRLSIAKVVEYDFGWVFTYNSKQTVETESMTHSLIGNAPLIVDRNNGLIYLTGTHRPIDFFIEQYRQNIRTLA
jgi:hypothetical protein